MHILTFDRSRGRLCLHGVNDETDERRMTAFGGLRVLQSEAVRSLDEGSVVGGCG